LWGVVVEETKAHQGCSVEWQVACCFLYKAKDFSAPLRMYVAKDLSGTFFYLRNTEKPVLNGPFIKRNFVLNGNIFRSLDYHSIPSLNGNLASAEKCFGLLRFRLRQILLY
jgi:hypothetical protein